MTTTVASPRRRFHGLLQIVRFNWPFYLIASAAIAISIVLGSLLLLDPRAKTLLFIGDALAAYFVIASLLASYLIYDRSRLCRWDWIAAALPDFPRRWINIHSGLDESSTSIRSLFPHSTGRTFDIFDPTVMTEPSIARARNVANNHSDERVDFRALPLTPNSIDAGLLLLSAHELRTSRDRRMLLSQLARSLTTGGVILLAEHLRNLPNFLAFGPGFLHFHSRRTWLSDIRAAGLSITVEFSITPFVRVFLLRRSS